MRQGCVLYPLDLQQIKRDVDKWDVYSLRNVPLIIDMPIGSVSVSTSREQIGYDAETVANLRAAFLKVMETARADMVASFDAYDDYHDACTAFAQTPDVLFQLTGYGKTKWRGQFDLRKTFTISGRPTVSHLRACLVETDKVVFINREVKDITPQALKGGVVLFQDEDLQQAGLRIRAYIEANGDDRPIVWSKGDADSLAKDLGLTEIIDLETIEPLKIERTKSAPRFQRSDLRTFSEHRLVVRDHDLDTGGFFVMTNGASYVWNGKSQNFKTIEDNILRLARKLGLMPAWNQQFALLQTQQAIPTKHRGWTSLEDHLKAQVKHFDPKVYAQQMGFYRLTNSSLWNSVIEFRDQLPKRLLAFVKKVEAANTKGEVHTHELQLLWRRLFDQPEIAVDDAPSEQFKALMKNYPLWEELQRANRRALLTNYCSLLRK